jgi:hypothetical protein
MKTCSLFLIMMALAVASYAQTKVPTTATPAAPIDPLLKGIDVLSQLAAALDESSFYNSWTAAQKVAWMDALTQATDAVGLSKSASALTEYIKSDSYKDGVSLANLRLQASEAKNYGDAANVIGMIESALKPQAYDNDWVSKEASWWSELKLVK